jgi:hypothetical protein
MGEVPAADPASELFDAVLGRGEIYVLGRPEGDARPLAGDHGVRFEASDKEFFAELRARLAGF